jgi:hypothetical protein
MAYEKPSLRSDRGAAGSKLVRARTLAAEIEELLGALPPNEIADAPYQVRVAQGLTRSLIDQLDELERGPSSRRLLGARRGEDAPYGVRSLDGR